MKKNKILVKTESIREFFINNYFHSRTEDIIKQSSVYYLFKDKIPVKKGGLISEGDEIVFEFEDRTARTDYPIKNVYKYEAVKYDDISLVLELIDFKVEPINKKS